MITALCWPLAGQRRLDGLRAQRGGTEFLTMRNAKKEKQCQPHDQHCFRESIYDNGVRTALLFGKFVNLADGVIDTAHLPGKETEADE